MIPPLIDMGGPWKLLPPGIHFATFDEIYGIYASSKHRRKLFQGFRNACLSLTKAGCKRVYLDGSFIGEKDLPGDFDACWETSGVQIPQLNPIFLCFKNARASQKLMYLGEFFPAHCLADGSMTYLAYFQKDKHSGAAKGIIGVDL